MNQTYYPEAENFSFLLNDVLQWQSLFSLPKFEHVDSDLGEAILSEGAKFCGEVLAPINRAGDEKGCQLIEGRVLMPEEYITAFQQFKDNGWVSLDLPECVGGHALPLVLGAAVSEMVSGSCIAFGMFPVLLKSAATLLLAKGTDQEIEAIVPKLVSGEWGATICISESQAGSDVGLINTKAKKNREGSYFINGAKIFITCGDQNYTDQIVHLVLAKTESSGHKGMEISLFWVPKLALDDGSSNGVTVGSLEKKMGLKGSPTCQMYFDNAKGYLIGEEGAGLAQLFTMMNVMRLEVAVQGVGIASAATQKATAYARERVQGRKNDGSVARLSDHADVQRMLMTMRAKTESIRALVLEVALLLDKSEAETNTKVVNKSLTLAEFLLPVCKAFGSEVGVNVADMAIQILGGHGYITDEGVEQFLRDGRAMPIYEGANGIQALDLVRRKLLKSQGLGYKELLSRIENDVARCSDIEGLGELVSSFTKELVRLKECTDYLVELNSCPEKNIEASATPYLHLVGWVACGWMWLRLAEAAIHHPSKDERLTIAEYFICYLMSETLSLEQKIYSGSQYLSKAAKKVFT